MKQWEYKLESIAYTNLNFFNELGKDGWELCGIVHNPLHRRAVTFSNEKFEPRNRLALLLRNEKDAGK